MLHMLDNHYEVFGQFVRGDFALENLFVKGSATVDMTRKAKDFNESSIAYLERDSTMITHPPQLHQSS